MLLLLRCFRPDYILPSIRWYIQQTMGVEYLKVPIINFCKIYEESSETRPIVCVPAVDMDPTDMIFEMRVQVDKTKTNISVLSLMYNIQNVILYGFLYTVYK